jgi:hypothetical protein
MQKLIGQPVNALQDVFNELCLKGGGQKGGPARTRVQQAIREYGQLLNSSAYDQMAEAFEWVPDANPWHVTFAMGLCWGTIAKHEQAFFVAAVGAIAEWNDRDRGEAVRYHLEKGADLLEGSLRSAYRLFEATPLPDTLPDTLENLGKRQDRWLRSVSEINPAYIGPWNSLALFMCALFAQPDLAKTMRVARPLLPPGGPITKGLSLLHKAGIINAPPNTQDDDERAAAIGAAVEDNALMQDILRGLDDCSMVDIHTGIYLLGTGDRRSRKWLDDLL